MSEFEDDLDGGDGTTDGDDGAPAKDPSNTSGDPKSTDKRVSDLQSKADKETARANKAEAALKRFQDAMKDPDAEGGKPPVSAGSDMATNAILEMARMFAVQQNPKLAEYGLSASDLNGSSPSEIAQSAAALVARFEKIETQARNKVLAANGLAPEIDSAASELPPARDFSKMSKEDFEKVMASALNGRGA